MKVAVCQIGARHRYAVPDMLESSGLLGAFYCDANAAHPLFRMGGKIGLLMGRSCPPTIPKSKIFSTIKPNFYIWQRHIFGRGLKSDDFIEQGRLFSKWILRHWDDSCDLLLTFSRINSDLARQLKARGVRNAVDVIISPLTERILTREYARRPEWSPPGHGLPPEQVAREEAYWRDTISAADVLLCPSAWVADGVLTLAPEAGPKIRLVPYGCSIDFGAARNIPTPGKVIFCGNDPCRKGLAYLAEAAELLAKSHPDIRIEVIGALDERFRHDSRCAFLHFVGKCGREEMIRHYLSADVMVLPSLSEGFAAVIAEAVCAGVPCVVTRESGSGIVDGRDGRVVPAASAEALAEAIVGIVANRELRQRMSDACVSQRDFYSRESWRKRLVEALA